MPELRIIYQSDHFKIEADDALAYVRTEWLHPVDDEQFMLESMRSHATVTATRAEKMLMNAEFVSAVSPVTKDWLANIYYDLFTHTSLKKMARVMPDNLFRKLAMESVVARAEATDELTYEIRDFPSEEEAVNWLLER
ncbi:hypothetical protein [Pontibacter flavimaris]|uniref:STAS/SEC14 domain-containing protein n=1 Tax=Pontibacter flavimaris TaxID=1797110 RepID=A0A1Q5PF86_9BACT|nr:hypothetical protein [Pontibacter flavimaris]OKL40905.1 hypothetical protein A3841_13760 [Pontibacter flavimaris]